jgi:regulatory protein
VTSNLITALEPDPRRAGAVRVLVAGELFGTVSEETVRAERLAVGRALDEALADRLLQAADAEAAFRTVLRSLEVRSYARRDLARRLVRKGHPRAAVDHAIERVASLGLLDDAAFARNFVQTRAARGRGPARLVRDLMAMGVDRSVVDAAVAAEWDADDGRDRADVPRALAAKRAAQLGPLPRDVKRRRLLAYLARRGFTGTEALRAVEQAVDRAAS